MVACMSIVLDGVAGHRLMFDDPQRMHRVWPLVVDSVVRVLELRAGDAPSDVFWLLWRWLATGRREVKV